MPDPPPPLLRIDGLSVSYRTRSRWVAAVRDLSLALERGQSLGLVGESGCGKSTVAFAVMQALGPNAAVAGGRILFRGRDLGALDERELRRLRGAEIALVSQEPAAALNPVLTIGDQLAEVPRIHGRADRRKARRQAARMLAEVRVGDPARVMAAYPHQLSGGEAQRAVIAMALLGRPSLLLLDEPTTALDVTVEAAIVNLVADVHRRRGTGLLFITHNLALVRGACERVAVMYAGSVVEEGPVGVIFAAPRHPYTRGLLACLPDPTAASPRRLEPLPGEFRPGAPVAPGCAFAPRCGHFRPGVCDTDPLPLETVEDEGVRVRCPRWREIGGWEGPAREPARPPPAAGPELLRVEDLRKDYPRRERRWRGGAPAGPVRALTSVSLSLRRGETLAVVGESGCGKSTLAKVVAGLEKASGGSVRLMGEEVGGIPAEARTPAQRRAVRMIFQNPDGTLNPSFAVGTQIARAVRALGVARGRKAVRARVRHALGLVRLPPETARRMPRRLSGGEKQRIAIARAFVGEPALVIADEPTSALDASVQAAVVEVLADVQRRLGTALLFITHDLGLVRHVADRVLVMLGGRVMEEGPTPRVFRPPFHPYTKMLLSAVPKPREGGRGPASGPGDPPAGAADAARGCPFHRRCPRKMGEICERESPPERRPGPDHRIACHLPLSELLRDPRVD